MSNDLAARVVELEQDNARLRRLLNAQNTPGTLRHQVRNSLGFLRAILRRSAETKASVEDYVAHLEGRLDALLRIQTLLISGLDEKVSLHALLANELVAHLIHEGEQAAVDGPPVQLGPKSAHLLGLAFHELVVNAIKFGALATKAGQVHVAWSLPQEGPGLLDLSWTESGPRGLPLPTFRGFGAVTLEDMLRYELEANSTLEFRPTGMAFTLKAPLAKFQS